MFHKKLQKVDHDYFLVVYTIKLLWNTYFMKCSERNISQGNLAFRNRKYFLPKYLSIFLNYCFWKISSLRIVENGWKYQRAMITRNRYHIFFFLLYVSLWDLSAMWLYARISPNLALHCNMVAAGFYQWEDWKIVLVENFAVLKSVL